MSCEKDERVIIDIKDSKTDESIHGFRPPGDILILVTPGGHRDYVRVKDVRNSMTLNDANYPTQIVIVLETELCDKGP